MTTDAVPPPADPDSVLERLGQPFAADEVKWKPQAVKGNRCMAICYLDARAVADRLDEVLGLGWSDEYSVLPDKSVSCRLTVRVGGVAITREDVGSPSDQPDGGDRMKAAYSDALKRAAVKFGIGRYLYRLPSPWVDFDPAKKQIVSTPKLPPWALPTPPARPPAAAKPVQAIAAPQSPVPQQPAARGNPPDTLPEVQRVLDGLRNCGLSWSRQEDLEWIDVQLDECGHEFRVSGLVSPHDLVAPDADMVVAVLRAEYVRRRTEKAGAK